MTNTPNCNTFCKIGLTLFHKLRIAHKTTPLPAIISMQRSGLITHYQCGCLLVPVDENIQFRAYFFIIERHLGSLSIIFVFLLSQLKSSKVVHHNEVHKFL